MNTDASGKIRFGGALGLNLLAGALMVWLASTGSLWAQYQFTTIDDPLGTAFTNALGIDGSNIVGDYQGADGRTEGYILSGTTFTTISDPADANGTEVTAISGSNILGENLNSSGFPDGSGFILSGTTYTQIPNYGAEYWGISGTNVVGYVIDSDVAPQGLLLSGSITTNLYASGASGYYPFTVPYGISGNEIVGGFGSVGQPEQGFILMDGTYATVDDPLAKNETELHGVSGANIVGEYTDSNGSLHGLLLTGTNFTTIDDPLGAQGTSAFGISGSDIVGYYTDSNGKTHGFLATPVPEPAGIIYLLLPALGLMLVSVRNGRWRPR